MRHWPRNRPWSHQECWHCRKVTIFVEMAQKRRLQQGFCQIHARASYPWSAVSSPRPRSFQLSVVNIVSKAQALADVPYVGPVFGVSKTSISGFVAVGPHCIYIYIIFLGKKPLLRTAHRSFSYISDMYTKMILRLSCFLMDLPLLVQGVYTMIPSRKAVQLYTE